MTSVGTAPTPAWSFGGGRQDVGKVGGIGGQADRG